MDLTSNPNIFPALPASACKYLQVLQISASLCKLRKPCKYLQVPKIRCKYIGYLQVILPWPIVPKNKKFAQLYLFVKTLRKLYNFTGFLKKIKILIRFSWFFEDNQENCTIFLVVQRKSRNSYNFPDFPKRNKKVVQFFML